MQYSTVTEMMKKLKALRLVRYEKYGGIVLTEKGEEIWRSVKDRHDTLCRLLRLAGVPAESSAKDACAMEHRLAPVYRAAQEAGQCPGDRRGPRPAGQVPRLGSPDPDLTFLGFLFSCRTSFG